MHDGFRRTIFINYVSPPLPMPIDRYVVSRVHLRDINLEIKDRCNARLSFRGSRLHKSHIYATQLIRASVHRLRTGAEGSEEREAAGDVHLAIHADQQREGVCEQQGVAGRDRV